MVEAPTAGRRKHEPLTVGEGTRKAQDESTRGANLKVTFPGANAHPTLESFGRMDTHVSYLIGNDSEAWRSDVPVWAGVRYRDLYPGIDLELASENGSLAQRMVARPGADLSAVRLRVEGAEALALDGERVRLTTTAGEILPAPLPGGG